MKITQEVRRFAEEKGLEEQVALEAGMREKAEAFKEAGSEIYL
jgi:phosphomethylpyrimidine synthase